MATDLFDPDATQAIPPPDAPVEIHYQFNLRRRKRQHSLDIPIPLGFWQVLVAVVAIVCLLAGLYQARNGVSPLGNPAPFWAAFCGGAWIVVLVLTQQIKMNAASLVESRNMTVESAHLTLSSAEHAPPEQQAPATTRSFPTPMRRRADPRGGSTSST